jgi:Ras-related C3 botulinum toxin substrate 1
MIHASVVNNISFKTIKSKWIPEAKHHCPEVPVVILGTKIDLRDDIELTQRLLDSGKSFVTTSMGQQIAQDVGAVSYIETSAKLFKTKHAFDEALRSDGGL